MLLSLHGAGGSSGISIYETNLTERAEKDGFPVVFPDALPKDISKKADFKNNPRIWQAKAIDGIESPDLFFLTELIKSLCNEYDVNNVFATGFSNGAIMCSYLAVKIPDVISAIAPVCGKLVTPDTLTEPPIPIFLIVGNSDPLFPVNGGEVKLFWGNKINIPSLEEYSTPWINLISAPRVVTSLSNENYETVIYRNKLTELNITRIFNHGHIWPGGKSKLTYRITGQPNRNISANDMIIEFFKRIGK